MRAKSRKSVLVVDDDALTLSLVATLLESQGHRVESVRDGVSALNAVQHRRPDLVLVDIALPRMDGYTLTKKLRDQLGPDIPIVGLTGRPGRNPEAERAAGFSGWIEKPFEVSALLETVSKHLS